MSKIKLILNKTKTKNAKVVLRTKHSIKNKTGLLKINSKMSRFKENFQDKENKEVPAMKAQAEKVIRKEEDNWKRRKDFREKGLKEVKINSQEIEFEILNDHETHT